MKKIFSALCFSFLFFSCVPDEDFGVPLSQNFTEVDLDANTDLDAILGRHFQNPNEIYTFQEDYVIEVFVVSSDAAGNFYKEVIVQDRPEKPTAGINIMINMNSYFQFFDFGRKIYINLKGLSIGEANGVAAVGYLEGKQIVGIPQARVSDHLIRSSVVAEIVPLVLQPIEFSDRTENLFVQVKNVQFSSILVGADNPFTYASEDNDEFDGERLVESCSGGFPFILSTSTYSDFAAFRLPAGSGSITGVLTRDFYDSFFTVYLNEPSGIDFSSEERCDEITFDCGTADETGSKILFSEDFTSEKNNKPVLGNGWTNFIQEGSKAWEGFTATGENASLGRSARVRPAGSGDQKSVVWLITPRINFDTNKKEVLNFKTSTSFADGSQMQVLISTDWNGADETILAAEWKLLSSAYVARNSDFFGDWISSGNVDLSCAEGKGHIAFRYTGSDLPDYDGIYELDDVLITAEGD